MTYVARHVPMVTRRRSVTRNPVPLRVGLALGAWISLGLWAGLIWLAAQILP